MCRAVDTLYGSNVGKMPTADISDLISSILEIEVELINWRDSLPKSVRLLRPDELASTDCDSIETRFRIILTLRYHNLRILVHRPILDYQLEGRQRQSTSPADSRPVASRLPQAGQRCISILQSSAGTIVSLVRAATEPSLAHKHLLGAWWFTLYYSKWLLFPFQHKAEDSLQSAFEAFNAAVAIAAVVVCQHTNSPPNIQGSPESISVLGSVPKSVSSEIREKKSQIDNAIICLPRIDTGNRMVEKCTSLTRALSSSLEVLCMSASALPLVPAMNFTDTTY